MNDETFVFQASKLKAFFLFFLSSLFVAGGIFTIAQGEVTGWFVTCYFWLVTCANLYILIPGNIYLKIDRFGIEVATFLQPWKLNWTDVDNFYIAYIPTGIIKTKIIAIQYSRTCNKWQNIRLINVLLTGIQGGITNSYNRSAEEICAALNDGKRRWG